MSDLVREKVDQAIAILDEFGIDCWLTFARETTEGGDPVLPLILDRPLTWQSALILTNAGDRIAIVGRFEEEAVASTGAWNEVIPYVEGIAEPLREVLERLDPENIALNFSLSDPKADGLSHGMFELLFEHLEDTPYAERFQSAEAVVSALRGRKGDSEIGHILHAVQLTQTVLELVATQTQVGMRETEIAALARDETARLGAGLAWEPAQCPIVTTGPDSIVGHGLPSAALELERGRVLHLDFGARQNGYCADLQRSWYVPLAGESAPPDTLQRGFDAVRGAIEAAFAVLRPGVEGWEVDAAAREFLVEAGYPEYQHATGHQVGRSAHDGGGILGPRWERYGATPYALVEEGNVFTLELGIDDEEGRGYLGLEEMVLVTESGAEWLSDPQRELWLLLEGEGE